MFYCGRILLTVLNTAILKVWCIASQRSVSSDGHWEATIPVVEARDVTIGVAYETDLVLSIIFVFYTENTNIHEMKLKSHVITVTRTDLSRFVVIMHSGVCEQYVKFLGLSASGFYFLFRTHPRALWQKKPSRTGLRSFNTAFIEEKHRSKPN